MPRLCGTEEVRCSYIWLKTKEQSLADPRTSASSVERCIYLQIFPVLESSITSIFQLSNKNPKLKLSHCTLHDPPLSEDMKLGLFITLPVIASAAVLVPKKELKCVANIGGALFFSTNLQLYRSQHVYS
jgi:hypothetical protein